MSIHEPDRIGSATMSSPGEPQQQETSDAGTDRRFEVVVEAALAQSQIRPQELHAGLLPVSRLNAMGEMAAVAHDTIAAAHDGRLSAEPNPGGGAKFRLGLPPGPADGLRDG